MIAKNKPSTVRIKASAEDVVDGGSFILVRGSTLEEALSHLILQLGTIKTREILEKFDAVSST